MEAACGMRHAKCSQAQKCPEFQPALNAATMAVAELMATCRQGCPKRYGSSTWPWQWCRPTRRCPWVCCACLWGCDTVEEVLATCNVLAGAGVLRIATLQDGSAWTLVQPDHTTALAVHPTHGKQEFWVSRQPHTPFAGLLSLTDLLHVSSP